MAAEPKGNEPSSEEKTETPLQGDNATTDASTAAERQTQGQIIVPARRGKGFGIKNLRTMRDRSIQKTSDPDSSNNDAEPGDNNDDSKTDGKESGNEPTSGSTANVGEKAEVSSKNDERKVNDQKSNEATSQEPATEKTTTEVK